MLAWCIPETVMRQHVCLLIPTNSSQTVHVWTMAVPTMGISRAVWKVDYLHIVSCEVWTASVHKHDLRIRYVSKCKCKESLLFGKLRWLTTILQRLNCKPRWGICHEIWYVHKRSVEEGNNSKNCDSSLLVSGWVAV